MKIALFSLAVSAALSSSTAFLAPNVVGRNNVAATMSVSPTTESGGTEFFPTDLPFQRIEGGGTLRTYKLPPGAERVQYEVRTNGRPLKAKVELWLGPIRRTHCMDIDVMDGSKTPFRGTLLKFRGPEPVLKISTAPDCSGEFPLLAAVYAPPPQRQIEIMEEVQELWDSSPKSLVQGGSTWGGLGQVRTFDVDDTVDSVQLIIWSGETGRKSLKAKLEALAGPNNKRQFYDLHCGGGSQPYHCIIDTPGPGWTIRIQNKKFVEDGLFQVVAQPYSGEGEVHIRPDGAPAPARTAVATNPAKKEWWQ